MVKFFTPKDTTAVSFIGVDGDYLHVIYKFGNATEYRVRIGAELANKTVQSIQRGKSAGKTVRKIRDYAAQNALLWQSKRSDGVWITITH